MFLRPAPLDACSLGALPSGKAFEPAIHFIDGETVEGCGEELEVRYPATGEILGRIRAADDHQVAAAVAAGRSAFDSGVWRGWDSQRRAEILERIADALTERTEELVTKVVLDNGKTLGEARIDVMAAAAAFRSAAQSVRNDREVSMPTERGVTKQVRREPVGVVAALTPFNAPLMFAGLKAAPALAAGNSVVLKPSERAPYLPIVICEAAQQAGLPVGVLSLVHGRSETAAALCRDRGVDMISLTGGAAAGTAVMQAGAPTIKNLLLELGGKSAHIILADADLPRAIRAAAAAIFRNAGQRCFSGSRLIVEEAVADEVESGIVEIARALRLGDPFEESTQVGAMIDDAAVAAVESFVERAQNEGLAVAAGGCRVGEPKAGSFFAPTVLTAARSDSYAAQEEIFGPVLTIIRVPDPEAAVAAANATRYGLAGGVWTKDMERAQDIARRIRAGYFWINTYGAVFGDLPFGGFAMSGLGREGGQYSYEAYTELKSVMIDTTGGSSAPLF
jgi:acyl-CoA reductase-like NAD-dependent aldehyde dehydrogenase